MHRFGLCDEESIAAFNISLYLNREHVFWIFKAFRTYNIFFLNYLMTLLGSTPQLAAMITFGSACSILVRNSLAAKPL